MGGLWYHQESELIHIELCILAALVILALGFDYVFEKAREHAEASYSFMRSVRLEKKRRASVHSTALHGAAVSGGSGHGKKTSDGAIVTFVEHEHEEEQGRPLEAALFAELALRMGSEFMTLGFLGLTVFVCNSAGFFDMLARNLHSSKVVALPEEAGMWLHLVEDVHIKLFIGMVVYFALVGVVVARTNVDLHNLELLRTKWVDKKLAEFQSGSVSLPQSMTYTKTWRSLAAEAEFVSYCNSRSHLLQFVVKSFETLPARFKAEMQHKVALHNVEGNDFSESLKLILEERFDFTNYLALNINEGIWDSIKFHPITWSVLLVFVVFVSIMSRISHSVVVMYVCLFLSVLLAVIWLVMMRLYIKFLRKHIDDDLSGRHDGQEDTRMIKLLRYVNGHWNVEIFVMRGFQMVLFSLSYFLSRTLLNFSQWVHEPGWSAGVLSFVTATVLTLSHFMRMHAPEFLMLMSLPPNLDPADLAILSECIGDKIFIEDGKENIDGTLFDTVQYRREGPSLNLDGDSTSTSAIATGTRPLDLHRAFQQLAPLLSCAEACTPLQLSDDVGGDVDAMLKVLGSLSNKLALCRSGHAASLAPEPSAASAAAPSRSLHGRPALVKVLEKVLETEVLEEAEDPTFRLHH